MSGSNFSPEKPDTVGEIPRTVSIVLCAESLDRLNKGKVLVMAKTEGDADDCPINRVTVRGPKVNMPKNMQVAIEADGLHKVYIFAETNLEERMAAARILADKLASWN